MVFNFRIALLVLIAGISVPHSIHGEDDVDKYMWEFSCKEPEFADLALRHRLEALVLSFDKVHFLFKASVPANAPFASRSNLN